MSLRPKAVVLTPMQSGQKLLGCRSPPTMNWASTDVQQAFNKFKTKCQIMFDGPVAGKNEAVKVKHLLMWSGEEGFGVSRTWDLSDTESNTLMMFCVLGTVRKIRGPKKQLQNC